MTRLQSWIVPALSVAVLIGFASRAPAQVGTCNGFISISYPQTGPPNQVGAISRVRLSLSAGDIDGGSILTVMQLAFGLDCRNKGCTPNFLVNCTTTVDCPSGESCFNLGTNCIDDGNVIGFIGNISTTCATSWSTSTPNSSNEIVFTATPALQLSANASGCNIEFDIQKLSALSNDSTPNMIEQVAEFMNAMCDNGSNSSNAQSGFLQTGPPPPPPPPSNVAPAMSGLAVIGLAFGLGALGYRRLRRRRSP